MATELPFTTLNSNRNEPSSLFSAGKFARKKRGIFMLLLVLLFFALWLNSGMNNLDDSLDKQTKETVYESHASAVDHTTIGIIEEEELEEILAETKPVDTSVKMTPVDEVTVVEVIKELPIVKKYVPGHYRYLVVVASNASNRDRRQLIRDNYFGLVDNLRPCLKADKNLNYLFYIYGNDLKPKTAERRLYESEMMEWNDLHKDDSASFNQDRLLKWVNTTLRNRGVSFDYLIIQDDYSFIQLNYIQQKIQSEASLLPLDKKPTELIWRSSNTDAKDILVIGSEALKSVYEHEIILEDGPTEDTLLSRFHDYYQSIEVQLKFITAKEGRSRLNRLANQLPVFIQEKNNRFRQWENSIESIPSMTVAVSNIYQTRDFIALSHHLNSSPTSLCKTIDKPTIAVVTSSFIYEDSCMEPSASMAADNKRNYASSHGYAFVARSNEFAQQALYTEKRRTVWGKIDTIEKVLPKYDWIFWMDMDAVIMNPDISVHTILDELRNEYPGGPREFEANVDLVIAKPTHDKMINAGVFFMRNTPWSREFLKQVQGSKGWYNKGPSYEQGAMWDLIQYGENKRHVMLLDNDDHTFNTFPKKYQPGDFIVHFAPDKCPNPAVLKGLTAAQLLEQGGMIDSLDEA